jgi:hypothetical protein
MAIAAGDYFDATRKGSNVGCYGERHDEQPEVRKLADCFVVGIAPVPCIGYA